MSIFPYIYFMIKSFNITNNEDQIGFYAGLVTSAFAFAEFSTGVFWGRLSDKIGRKPVLMTGLIGTLMSMLVFGFAPNLPVALLGRALGGALNGNIGVLQTTVAEIVTHKEHQPSAYAIMPFVWSLGSILGPLIGGALAEPCKNYPQWFARGTLFDRYPFLLPNIVCSMILVVGILIGILFLEETHQEQKYRRDIGLEMGHRILKRIHQRRCPDPLDKSADANFEETGSLLEDEPPPGYRTSEGSPRFPASRSLSPAAPPYTRSKVSFRRPGTAAGVQKAFTRPVVVQIIAHTISFDQLMPIFLSTKSSKEQPILPFRFTGGFGMSSKDEGVLMVAQGFYAMFAQAILFPFLAKRYGCLRIFRAAVILWPLLYFMVPYMILLPQQYHIVGICFCLFWRVTAQALTFPPNNIMLTNSAPSKLVLGAINGVAGSTASLSRAFGPAITGFIHSKGLSIGVSGLSWWVTGLICMLGAAESMLMQESSMENKVADLMDEVAIDDRNMIDPMAIDAAIVAATQPRVHETKDVPRVAEDLPPPPPPASEVDRAAESSLTATTAPRMPR
ncbi:MAG: hypothetical protein Q9228_001490 [Teloschistes exilis]